MIHVFCQKMGAVTTEIQNKACNISGAHCSVATGKGTRSLYVYHSVGSAVRHRRMCEKQHHMYVWVYIYTWNPNDPCFGWSLGLVLRELTFKNIR